MNLLGKILIVLTTVLGTIAAIKTLIPEDISYISIITNTIFFSGWIAFAILMLFTIYQYETQNEKLKSRDELLDERKADKQYLKSELDKSNASLNHLTSRFALTEKPIPRTNREQDAE